MSKRVIFLIVFIVGLGMFLASAANADLVAWWTFDEGGGATAFDATGNGHDGAINGAQTTEGQMGLALLFDEVDDRVVVPDFDYSPEFSVTFWFRSSGNAGTLYQYMFSHAPYNASNSVNIYLCENNQTTPGVLRTALVDADDVTNQEGLDVVAGFADGNWHHYALTVGSGVGANVYVDALLQVSLASQGGDAFDPASDLYLGARVDLNAQRFFGGALDDVRVYNHPLSEAEIQEAMAGIPRGTASAPSPADQATDVPRDVVLSWRPGEYAPAVNGHIVHLSENFSDVNDGVGGITQSANSHAPGRLDFETTYYWRVDEVNAPPDSTVYPGEVWSFATEPIGYPIDGANIIATASSMGEADFGPEKTIDGSGLDESDLHSTEPVDMWLSGSEPLGAWIQYEFDRTHKLHQMWVWNSNQIFEGMFGFGLKDVTVEYSTNGVEWTALAGVPQFARAPGTAGYAHDTTVDFGGIVAQYVRLTAASNWGGLLPQYGLSEVRFFSIPVSAREPSPDSGATDVEVEATLSWRAGREAAKHDVYLSMDEQAVIDGTAAVTTASDASYSAPLDLGSTYFWRVDEVNNAETPAIWQGDVWDFTTQEYIVVDDFEDYNDYPPYEVYSTWTDGYEDPTNGSQAGNLTPPIMETGIVHGDAQSVPLFYSNTGGATHSEITRTFAVSQDWAKHGIRTLSLWFHGAAGNTGQLYVKINGAKVPYDGDAGNLAVAAWQPWNIDLTALGISLQSVTTLTIGIDGNGLAGMLYLDDIRLYAYSRQLTTPTDPGNAGLVAHYKLDQNANDSSGNGHNGVVEGAPTWANPGWDGTGACMKFGGDADRITVEPFELMGSGITLSAWINPATFQNDARMISKSVGGSTCTCQACIGPL
ncbi:MAG: LamG-like jellyroll fold domain-containing protein [Planctomycetota bacterium]